MEDHHLKGAWLALNNFRKRLGTSDVDSNLEFKNVVRFI